MELARCSKCRLALELRTTSDTGDPLHWYCERCQVIYAAWRFPLPVEIAAYQRIISELKKEGQ
jgi:hypothetical protein